MRSLLLPISMMVMLGFACWRASSSQLARWLKVSRLQELPRHEATADHVLYKLSVSRSRLSTPGTNTYLVMSYTSKAPAAPL